MIETEAAYKECLRRLREDEEFIRAQKKELAEAKLSPEEIQRVMEPTYCFYEQLREEVQSYEQERDIGSNQ